MFGPEPIMQTAAGRFAPPLIFMERKNKMPEFTNASVQTVAVGQNVLFTETPVKCGRGYVLHREGSGNITLRGITNQCRARYRVSFGANIAVPTGGTAGSVSLAVALDGEPVNSAVVTVTPAAVENYFNVYASVFVETPRGCCSTVSVENISPQAVNVANPNLIIERVA